MNGISCETWMEYGDRNEQLPGCERVIRKMRVLAFEHLVIDLEGYPGGLRFIQTTRDEDGYVVELRREEEDGPRVLRKEGLGLAETLETFRSVCLRAEVPEGGWEDVTEELLGDGGEDGAEDGPEPDDIPFERDLFSDPVPWLLFHVPDGDDPPVPVKGRILYLKDYRKPEDGGR